MRPPLRLPLRLRAFAPASVFGRPTIWRTREVRGAAVVLGSRQRSRAGDGPAPSAVAKDGHTPKFPGVPCRLHVCRRPVSCRLPKRGRPGMRQNHAGCGNRASVDGRSFRRRASPDVAPSGVAESGFEHGSLSGSEGQAVPSLRRPDRGQPQAHQGRDDPAGDARVPRPAEHRVRRPPDREAEAPLPLLDAGEAVPPLPRHRQEEQGEHGQHDDAAARVAAGQRPPPARRRPQHLGRPADRRPRPRKGRRRQDRHRQLPASSRA